MGSDCISSWSLLIFLLSYTFTVLTASREFGTYRLCEQRRFRRACASAQSRQNLHCSLIQTVSQEEPSDRKPDPWPLWMAGHAQLKFVMTECPKTQIHLTGLNLEINFKWIAVKSAALLCYATTNTCLLPTVCRQPTLTRLEQVTNPVGPLQTVDLICMFLFTQSTFFFIWLWRPLFYQLGDIKTSEQ